MPAVRYLAAIATAATTATALAQPTLLWSATYAGPAGELDRAEGMFVDDSGNVYITGSSDQGPTRDDLVTVKFDANGNIVWSHAWDGGCCSDYGVGVGKDAAGNVYVGGYTYTGPKVVLLKYDDNGNLIWQRIYDGGGNFNNVATDLHVAPNGDTWIVGRVSFSSTSDFGIWKTDANGNLQWSRSYNGPGNSWDTVADLAVDSDGNSYITGGGRIPGGGSEWTTIKYSPSGTQLWIRTYPAGIGDDSTSLAVDKNANVYVVGRTRNTFSDHDMTIIKYDTNGNQQWLRNYSGPANGEERAEHVAVAPDGTITMAGWSQGVGTGYDWATLRYDANGNQLWAKRYTGPGSNWDVPDGGIVFDKDSNAYIAGYSTAIASGDIAIVKYAPNGDQLWDTIYNGTGNRVDGAKGIALAPNGDIVIGGTTGVGNSNDDYIALRYSQTPPCPADINNDGLVNTDDFLDYLNLWNAGNPAADWDGNGVINTADFPQFLNDWVTVHLSGGVCPT